MTTPALRIPQQRLAIPTGSPDLFETFRNAMSGMFRWELPRGLHPAGFDAKVTGLHMGIFNFSTSTMTGGDLFRDRQVLARSGTDPILLQVYTEDPYGYVADGRSGAIRPGDIAVFDLGRPLAIEAPHVLNFTLTVTRPVIEPLVKSLDDINGRVFPRRSRYGRLLTHHIKTFATRYDHLDPDEAAIVADSTPGLVAACIGPSEVGREQARAAVRLAVFGLIRDEIDRRLDDPDIGADAIQAAFGLSRSVLYRMFEPFGGVARYIAGRRLDHIHKLIRDPAFRHRPVSAIAAGYGYGNSSAFARAFHRRYGLTPTDLRAAQSKDDGEPDTSGEVDTLHTLRNWVNAF